MARRDSITWFVMGVAQLLLGQAIMDSAAAGSITEALAWMIQITGGGTFA